VDSDEGDYSKTAIVEYKVDYPIDLAGKITTKRGQLRVIPDSCF
jgi:hypothetical protein